MRTTGTGVQALVAQANAKLSEAATTAPAASEKSSASEKLAKVSPALAKAHDRIDARAQTASSSWSVLGQFKSSLDGLGSAAQDLSSLSAGSPAATLQSAVEKLVASYNTTLQSSSAVTTDGGARDAAAGRTQRDLRSALVAAAGGSAGLSRLGLTQQKDGTLSFDAKAFGKAVLADAGGVVTALGSIGQHVGDGAAKALQADSQLSASLTHLGDRTLALKQQQSAVLDVATRMAQSGLGSSSGSLASTLLAAYQSNA